MLLHEDKSEGFQLKGPCRKRHPREQAGGAGNQVIIKYLDLKGLIWSYAELRNNNTFYDSTFIDSSAEHSSRAREEKRSIAA